jgi:hypothetical protein
MMRAAAPPMIDRRSSAIDAPGALPSRPPEKRYRT